MRMACNKTFDPKPQLERLLTPALAPHGFVLQKGRWGWCPSSRRCRRRPVTLTRFDDLWCPFREAMHVERWAVVLAPILIAAGERFGRGAPRTEAPRRQSPRLRTSRSNRQKRRQR